MVVFALFACRPQVQAAAVAPLSNCEGWSAPSHLGNLQDGRIREASGLALSRRDPGRLWTHNDHGNGAQLFAVGIDGSAQQVLTLKGASSRDWEDIATGVVGTHPVLFVANTGNNNGDQRVVQVLRVREPKSDVRSTSEFDVLNLRWPKKKHDVESLAWDPLSGDLILASKEKGRTRFFRAKGAAPKGSEQILEPLGKARLTDDGIGEGAKATAMDISADGGRLYLRTSTAVLVWERPTKNTSVRELLAQAPCLAPSPVEPDSEALAATPNGFLTTSEGRKPVLWGVEIR